MKTKNLGYSLEQVQSFLEKMNEVKKIKDNLYLFHEAYIEISDLENLDVNSSIPIKRSLMTLSGNSADIAKFEMDFLLNYMTMGG